ncbi:hypothetical protein M0R45_032071 [Rubus argutus]|uniref:Uncharacterized protein n=1 Tax=Rubus argutus TaxID=59490 RepID=A0AAW1WFU6_RUBAR
MLGLCCRRLQLLLVPSCSIAVDYSVIHFHSIQTSSLLGAQIDGKGPSFTVSYLINSCGLSPEQAPSLSSKHRVHFNSPEKPDSIIKLLKRYGFNETHISQIVKKCPRLLSVNARRTLLPKLEFFGSIGVEGTGLVQLVFANPHVLIHSLEGISDLVMI